MYAEADRRAHAYEGDPIDRGVGLEVEPVVGHSKEAAEIEVKERPTVK
jgi:hypothetical protein